MSDNALCFGDFRLDPANRQLSRGGGAVEINSRYLDALILLVKARGELVPKERFMEEVWRGVPVTDEALTQAIKTLRRILGDNAGAPEYIQTVPKHGYRFIAPVAAVNSIAESARPLPRPSRSSFLQLTFSGTLGAILAGALIGLLYGFLGAAQPDAGAGGAVSLVLVLVIISTCSAAVAGFGIAAGISASQFVRPIRWYWTAAGGALGGLALGACANLLGRDTFRLLFGEPVGDFAGALEGLILGGIVGLAASFAVLELRRALSIAALLGASAGLAIALLDGRMMAGSLQALASAFPSSAFRVDVIGQALGEDSFGPISKGITAAFEGAIFSAGMVLVLGLSGTAVRGHKPDQTSEGELPRVAFDRQ